MKVKIFKESQMPVLEKSINDFIKDKVNVDVKINSIEYGQGIVNVIALITYSE
jgi:hypothetical protein